MAVVARDDDFDMVDFPETPIADKFAGVAESATGALLRPCLPNAFVFPCSSNKLAPFLNSEGEGFFDVNILAVAHSIQGGKSMPVVRRGNDDGIHARMARKFAKIVKLQAGVARTKNRVDVVRDAGAAAPVNIAHGKRKGALRGRDAANDVFKIGAAHDTAADKAEIDTFRRRVGPKYFRWNDGGESSKGSNRATKTDKVPS